MADEKVTVTDATPDVVTDAPLKADLVAAASEVEAKVYDETLAFHSLPTQEFKDALEDERTEEEKKIAEEIEKGRQAILANPHHLVAQLDQVDTSGTSGRTDSRNIQASNVAFVHPARAAAMAGSKLVADKADKAALLASLKDSATATAVVHVDSDGKVAEVK